MISVLDSLSKELLNCKTQQAHNYIDDLSLIHLRGTEARPLFVSCLLHGNETTGFYALMDLLREVEGQCLPRDMIILIGNTLAAKKGLRHLPGQPDYNRIWNGGTSLESKRACKIIEYVEKFNPIAAVDLHNSTGRNPTYVAINNLSASTLALGNHLSPRIVFFKEPHTTLSGALSRVCPSVTFEAGVSGCTQRRNEVRHLIRGLLFSKAMPCLESTRTQIKVFHSYGRVMIPNQISFSFGTEGDLILDPELDRHNFNSVPQGTEIGKFIGDARLRVVDENNHEIGGRFFAYQNGVIRVKEEFVPSLISVDPVVVRQDLLGYIMEQLVVQI